MPIEDPFAGQWWNEPVNPAVRIIIVMAIATIIIAIGAGLYWWLS